ncbi:hypothetical protein [Paenibacillus tyrfis]|uniref:hypothetical protein n=1 Tax=Paenibacillus tyrfis TaxID=1501230 RepID=UPI00117C93A0|nr:hypothetical protein [Paenibacillus tyrfis]
MSPNYPSSPACPRSSEVLAYACYQYGLNPATDITVHHILDPPVKQPMNALRLLGKTFEQFICDGMYGRGGERACVK